MKKIILILILNLLLTIPAYALSKQEKVSKILELTNSQQAITAGLDNAFLEISCSFILSPEQEDNVKKEFEEAMGLPSLLNSLTQFWVDNYTDQELDAILAFYQTEAGQKVASLQPKYAVYTQQVFQEWAKGMIPSMSELGKKYAQQYRQRSGSEVEACMHSRKAK